MADDLIPPQIQNGGAGSVQVGGVRAPDYRQLQEPEQIDVRMIDRDADGVIASAHQRAAALAGAFKDFDNVVQGVTTPLLRQAGARAGAAAGMAGNPQPKTGLASITEYGSAYDAAAHVTYTNEVQQHAAQTLDQIEQDSPGNPIAFQTRAQAVMDAAVKQAPPIYAPEVQQMYALRIQAGVTRLRGQAIEGAKTDALDSYLSTVDSRINTAVQTASALPEDQQTAVMAKLSADNQAQLAALVKAGAISQGKADLLAEKFSNSAQDAVHKNYTTNIVNHMMDIARSGDVDASNRALHQYVTDPSNADEDKQRVTTEYLAQFDKFTQAQSRLHANDIAGVGQLLAQGKYGQDVEPTIHGLYKQGALSPELLHSLLDQSMRNQVEAIKKSSSSQMVDAVIHGEAPKLDPADKEQVKAADTYFQTHVQLSGVPPLSDVWTAGVSNFARATNIVPPTALSQIRIGLLNPATAAQAAASAERIRSANPALDPYDKDPHSAAYANEINQNLKAGMPAQQAVQLAQQTVNRPEAERKIIEKNYSAITKQDPQGNAKALASALDAAIPHSLFGHAPAAPVALQAEYDRLVGTYYGLTSNINTARDLAAKQVRTTWSVTQMNGAPELVKYAPERLGVPADVIRNDVASSARAAGYTGDPAQIHLTPNAYTDSTNGRVWTLTHIGPDGAPDVLLDKDNRPLLYHVPLGQDFAKARQALIDQKIAAARAQRDRDRANAAEPSPVEQQLSQMYLHGQVK